ncbi:MAG: hypothetical protein FWF50_02945, partial [Defluviitaleaceae bacterium]|nr:hypothetical protein [Defluviitaleaceae bacterium]
MAALISELDIGDNQDNYLDAYGGFANPHLLDHGIDLENPLFEIPDYFYGYWEEVLPVQSHYGVIGAMASIAPFNSPNLVTTPPLVSAAYISTPQELTQFLNSDLGFEDNYGHFRITANIDMSSEPATRGRAGVFSGILDGNGHTVTNLRLEPNEEYLIQVPAYVAAPINGVSQIRAIGLVQQLGEGGRIRNLTLHNDEDLAFYNNLIAPPNQHQTSSALQVISDRNYLYHWNHALIPSYVGMFAGTVLSGEAFLQNVHLTGHTVFKNNIQSPTSGTGVSDNSTRQGIDVAARSQTFGGLVGSVVGGTLNIVDSSVYNLEFTMGHGGSLPTAAGNFIPPHYEGGAPRSFGGLVGSAYSGTTNITTATQGFRTTIGIRTNTFIGSEGNNGTGSTARDISRRINYVGGVIARVNGGNINISNVTTTGRAGFNRTGFTIISQAVGLHPPVGEGANLINPIPHTANFNIVANRRAGGIIGYTRSHNVRIRDVMNYLNVRVANDITTAVVGGAAAGLGNAGGIVGRSNGNNLYIRNAGNMGKVVQHRLGANLQAPAATRNNNHSGAGGIVGHSSGNSLSINTSFNAGAIDGNHSGAGGILGHNGAGNTTLTNVYNIGSVASRARLGGNGLVGRNRAGHVTIENAFVAANVTGVAVGARAMGNNPGGNQAHNRLLGFTLSNVYVDFEVLTPPGQINGHINTATSATGFAIPSLGANRGNSDRSQSASGLGQAANVTGVTTELLTRGTLPGISVGAANSPWRTGIQGVDASVFRTYPHFYWQIPGGERAEQFFTGISPSIGHMYTDNEYSYEREAVFTIVSGANSAFANLTPYRFFHTYRFPGLLIGTGNNPAINYPTFATHDPITDPVMAVHNFTRPAALRTNVGIINPQGIIGFTIGSMELSLYMRVLHYETLEPIHGSRLTSQNFVEGAEISGINGEFYLSQRWDAAAGYGIITVRAPHFRPYGYNNPDHPQYGVAHITHLVTLDDMESRLIEWHFIPWHEDVIGWMRYERTEAQIQSDTPGDVITRTHFEFEREEVFQPRLSNYSFDLAHLLAGERITARLPYQGFAENDFIYDSPMLRWEYTHIDPDYPQFNEGNWHLDVYMRDVTLDGNPLRRLRIFEIASPLG